MTIKLAFFPSKTMVCGVQTYIMLFETLAGIEKLESVGIRNQFDKPI